MVIILFALPEVYIPVVKQVKYVLIFTQEIKSEMTAPSIVRKCA